MDIFARPIKYIEGQYLLINYVFEAKTGQKFEFSIFLKKRFAPNLKIKTSLLMNAMCRQLCIPAKINILGFTTFKTNLAIKLVHNDEHSIVHEGSEWALKVHQPMASVNNLVKRTLNKLQLTQDYDFLMKSESYQN